MIRWGARAGLVIAVFISMVAGVVSAPAVSTTVVFPQDGSTVAGGVVPLAVDIRGFKVDCGLAGKATQEGVGHWHVILDGGLIDMACGPGYLVNLRNVKPGQHTLIAVPALNNHMEIKEAAAKVTFAYQPETAVPAVRGVSAGKPSLSIAFPRNGAAASGQTFPLILNVRNFRLSCELQGKPNLAGTGHWHVHLDKMAPGMAGLATMMAMGCSNTFEVPLKGIAPGAHTFIVVLTDNLHAPISPMVAAQVTVSVK